VQANYLVTNEKTQWPKISTKLTPSFKRKVERLKVKKVLSKKATKATPMD
jgi:hypothetical protein